MSLPHGWTTRRPTLDDVAAILAVVHASDIAAIGAPDFSPEDVREALLAPNVDPSRDSWLAVDPTGEVSAWAYLESPSRGEREMIEVYVYPGRGEPAAAPLLDRQLARVAQRAAEFGYDRLTVRAGAVPTEERWISVLEAAGFEFVKRYARMRRPLAGVSAVAPPPPPGVLVRPVDPSDEAELRLFFRILDTAFRDTPDYLPRSFEQWREQVAVLPTVAWDEWFLAIVDGVPGGILQSADQALDQNEGWVKNLAVLREYRRRGVGAALLARAFASYAGKGREHAGLGVDLANPTEAARLYRAVGMTPVYEANIYHRSVAAAPDGREDPRCADGGQ
ncbi:GNAT family N-acetyltransferase [Micromonospora sp. NBC_01699]|uniref:GNAT family N-acetyltransferase n=1 Tax=Micromonospora sp. NBC_01699 TaxID=2975984 RepID=UPI003FA5937C